MSLRDDIRALYRAFPNISGKEIWEKLGITPTKRHWQILNEEQVSKRGLYPARRHNTNAHRKVVSKGNIRFIPPKKPGE